jgi:hypothetical protein
MASLWAFVGLVGALMFLVGLCMQPFQAIRQLGRFALLLGILLFVAGFGLHSKAADEEAVAAGFADDIDRRAAKEAGVPDPAAWRTKKVELAEQKRKEVEEKQRLEAERQAVKEAQCRNDLQCWGEKFNIDASVTCRRYVERLAKNNFEWFDGTFESKFSHFRWKNRTQGIVSYIGDKIKFQNGFGAWIIHTYECDFDTTRKTVLDVRARPGRIPITN